MSITLILYSREGCHLCEDMLDQLTELESEFGFAVEVRDVDTNPAWVKQFGELVPILFSDNQEISRYFLDFKTLMEKIKNI